jgi:hypothetical protein
MASRSTPATAAAAPPRAAPAAAPPRARAPAGSRRAACPTPRGAPRSRPRQRERPPRPPGARPDPRLRAPRERAGADWRRIGAFGVGVAVGALLGAGTALLLAPATGFETRVRLARRARHVGDRVVDRFDDLGHVVRRGAKRTRSQVNRSLVRAPLGRRGRLGAPLAGGQAPRPSGGLRGAAWRRTGARRPVTPPRRRARLTSASAAPPPGACTSRRWPRSPAP